MQDRNGRCIMLVKQNKMSQWKTAMWFHIIDNFCVLHDQHNRADWSDIADAINQPGDSSCIKMYHLWLYLLYCWLLHGLLAVLSKTWNEKHMTGGCLESFTPVNNNFASPKLCTHQHYYYWPLVGFSSRNFEKKKGELWVCGQLLQKQQELHFDVEWNKM